MRKFVFTMELTKEEVQWIAGLLSLSSVCKFKKTHDGCASSSITDIFMKSLVVAIVMFQSIVAVAVSHSPNNLILLECKTSADDSRGFFAIETEESVNRATAWVDARDLVVGKVMLTGDKKQNVALFLAEKHPSKEEFHLVGVANLRRDTLVMNLEWIFPSSKTINYQCGVITEKTYGSYPKEGSVEYVDDYMLPVFELLNKRDDWREKLQKDFKM